MATEKTSLPPEDIIEKKILSKPKCQAILSLIAYFQQNKKNIQRAHLISALVKNQDSNSLSEKDFMTDGDKKILNDEKLMEKKSIIDRLQTLGQITPTIMFNSIANLDKTVQQLRKLGLITNQYMRGYPRIILTDKGLTLFYQYIIKRMVDELVHDGKQLMSISDHIFTSLIPKEKRKTTGFALPEFNDD